MRSTDPEVSVRRGPGRPRLQEPSPEFVARRREIVIAAAEVFREKGYDAGTLDDVATALDMRRPLLYYYVESKANLLFLILDRALDIGLAQLEEYSRIEDPIERLEALIRHQVVMVASQPDVFTVVFDHRNRLEPRFDEAIRRREREYSAHYRRAVEAGVEAGAIGDVNRRYATLSILGMLNWSYKWFQLEKDNLDELVEACIEIILRPRVDGSGRESRSVRRLL